MPIRAIFFDLDDTLLNDTEASERCAEQVARELGGDLGIAPEDLGAAYIDAAIEFWENLEPGGPRPPGSGIRRSMWRRALRKCGVADDALADRMAQRYDEMRIGYVELYPEVVPVLSDLRGRYHLAIITNGYRETHAAKIARLELNRFFDNLVLAGEVELVKPDPAIFRHAMESAGVGAGESVMVGDRFNRDVAGAHSAGMRAIWVNVRNERVPDGARPPEATISSIGELPRALAALEAAE